MFNQFQTFNQILFVYKRLIQFPPKILEPNLKKNKKKKNNWIMTSNRLITSNLKSHMKVQNWEGSELTPSKVLTGESDLGAAAFSFAQLVVCTAVVVMHLLKYLQVGLWGGLAFPRSSCSSSFSSSSTGKCQMQLISWVIGIIIHCLGSNGPTVK